MWHIQVESFFSSVIQSSKQTGVEGSSRREPCGKLNGEVASRRHMGFILEGVHSTQMLKQ